jgi:predicted nuclease of restriction endonuclease-like (RecB) superfamily
MEKEYIQFIADLKRNIVQSRYAAMRLANKEQLLLYFKTGKMLAEKIAAHQWGAKIIKQIADDLQKQLPGLRGFSDRNLINMKAFYAGYQSIIITQSASAEIDDTAFFSISFSHHILLLEKCKSVNERAFYMLQSASQFWSVDFLRRQIAANVFQHQGKLPNNFSETLSEPLRASVLQVFQDEYLMDFIDPGNTENERVFEQSIVADIKRLILTLGKGFCFIGNQYRLEVGGEEFFVDLLFFNRHLQCLVAFELKRGKFKPEYAGQLNFYLNVLDEKVRLPQENASIGIVLCKEKSNTVVEFSIRNIDKAMGVATYRTTREVPQEMRGIMPAAEELARLL